MSEQKQMFSWELLEQREKVQEELIKLQALVCKEVEDTSFLWCRDSIHIYIRDDIFPSQKESEMMKKIKTISV
jgi:hypothetical protein